MTGVVGLDLENIAKRFWPKVDVRSEDECWPWLARVEPGGYGRLSVGGRAGRMEGAHRVSILLATGSLPAPGMHTDHLCRNTICVNPKHLEVVTPSVNGLRGLARFNGGVQRARTHCPQGHEYSAQNTQLKKSGSRRCRTCARDYTRRYREERAA